MRGTLDCPLKYRRVCCQFKPADMVAFTLERLVTHELLIRVTADLSVPDGPDYEELGINLRGMVA